MRLEEWVKYGLDNKYLVKVNNKFKLTNNLQREYDSLDTNASSSGNTNLPAITGHKPSKRTTSGDIAELYHQFIIDADVPSRISNGRGGWYNGNRYSIRAATEFGRLLKSGINYQALVLSTKLYYKVTKECAVTITNYIVDGGWRTTYYEVLKKAGNNELESHVKHEMGEFGRDL